MLMTLPVRFVTVRNARSDLLAAPHHRNTSPSCHILRISGMLLTQPVRVMSRLDERHRLTGSSMVDTGKSSNHWKIGPDRSLPGNV